MAGAGTREGVREQRQRPGCVGTEHRAGTGRLRWTEGQGGREGGRLRRKLRKERK